MYIRACSISYLLLILFIFSIVSVFYEASVTVCGTIKENWFCSCVLLFLLLCQVLWCVCVCCFDMWCMLCYLMLFILYWWYGEWIKKHFGWKPAGSHSWGLLGSLKIIQIDVCLFIYLSVCLLDGDREQLTNRPVIFKLVLSLIRWRQSSSTRHLHLSALCCVHCYVSLLFPT